MKLDILFHYDVNENTGEITFIGQEEITINTAKTITKSIVKGTKTIDNNLEPTITLEPNKLILTQRAVDLLQVCEDCRIDIKYKKIGKKAIAVIGTDAAFKTKSGNKLTKSNTISYRGAANEKLAVFGTIFTLEPTEDKGIYLLVGDKIQEEHPVPLEIIDIESELDIELLDNFNIEEDEKNLGNFKYTL